MSFSLKDAAKTFSWPVDIQVPLKDGKFKKKSFVAEFEILSSEEMDAESETDGTNQADVVFCKKIVVGWDSKTISDEDGAPLEFSDDALNSLLQIPYVRVGVGRAYFSAMKGRARVKN